MGSVIAAGYMALKSKYKIQLTVGLLVGDEVNGSFAGRVPQHGVPGGPGQRDVARLRPEGVPVALHHVRQGQDVGVEVAVVELAEGLPPHDVGKCAWLSLDSTG